MDKRRMCPNCRAFITTSDRVCPYCEVQLGPRAAEIRSAESLSSFMPRAYSTSITIVIINFALYIAMIVVSVRLANDSTGDALGQVWKGFSLPVLVLFGGKYSVFIFQGQWWRLITAAFLHGSLLHIAMNTWVMFDLVAEVEQFYGTSRLITMYIVSSFTGFLLSLLISPHSISIGASAPCFGLIGAMMAIGLNRRNPMAQAIRSYYRRWAIYGLVFSFMPGIDMAAHIGGLIGGFLIGVIAGLPSRADSPRERVWQLAAAAMLLITVYCFAQDFLQYGPTFRALTS